MIDYSKSKLSVFAGYIKPYKKTFILDVLLSVTISLVDLVFPYISRWTMNTLLPENAFKTFFIVMGIMLFAYLLRAVFQYMVTVIGHAMGTKMEADMRRDVFTHMQNLSFSFFDKNRTGVLLSRVTNDLFEIVELSHHGPEHLITCTLTIIGSLVVLATINLKLTLVLAILLPACITFSMRQRIKMQKANKEVKKKTGEINAAIESGISGIRTSKAFANEKTEENKFEIANEQFKKTKVNFYSSMGLFNAGIEATLGIAQVAVITFGGFLIMKGSMSFIDLVTFTLYISAFTTPIRKLAMFMEMYAQGSAGFERFIELMRTQPEITDSPNAIELKNVNGDISFKDVSFHYADGNTVLDNISLDIHSGETIALVGPSGEGKTTICSLILRFYEVTKGSISLDGTDVREIQQDSLRKNIGIIQQDVFLFAGTVMENIRYGKPHATDEEVINAAKLAGIHEEIVKMPKGYDTNVGERGVSLSGGQKQRISIARVFLKNPSILILDEATSALDSITEAAIQKSLEELSEGKTCIVIAHRLSTVRNADRIIVIENGKIAEQGTRDELIKKDGHYARLEKTQITG